MLAMFSFVQAQDLTETLTKMAGSAAKGYVQPVASGFGANLNGGWFHKSPQTKIFGIDLEFGLVAMGTFTTDENKTFSANGAFRFGGGTVGSGSQAEDIAKNIPNYALLPALQKQQVIDAISSKEFQVGITGPTIVGTKQDTMKIAIPSQTITANGQTYNINGNTQTLDGVVGLLDGGTIIPLATPQASIGTIYGTQFTFRYLPDVEISPEIGKFKYFGFGIQHNLGMWLPIPVVDVSASFFTQNLKVGTIFESKATAFGLNASKQLGFAFLNVTPYAGFMLESSKMNVTYNFEVDKGAGVKETIPVAFELEGENKSRLTVGLSIRLLIININADYNIGKQNSATAGVFIAF
ncbi:MAG TPA: hypothetical protein DCQ28_06285 [Bacteroidetes bacterium]|nr:hypothetical protein [Bacteroidota bacterium]